MRFITLEPAEFRKLADHYPSKSFYQTPEIAQYREQNGWTAYYFGVTANDKIKAAAMMVAKPTFFGKSTYYCPGGPLIDYEDTELTDFFFRHLRRYLKSHNGYILHIEPYYELIQRDRDGEPVSGGFHRQKALRNLKNLGFIKLSHSDEPKYLFCLDLKNRTPDQLFTEMKRNTRNHIRKAEKMGVKVRELKREELNIFKQITESTSHRRNFTDKPLKYYEQMYDLFHPRGEVQFLVAEAEIDGEEPETEKQSEDTISKHLSDNGSESNMSGSKNSELSQRLEDNAFRGRSGGYDRGSEEREPRNDGRERLRSEESIISSRCPLSAAMFITYGDEVIYLFSGSNEKYMKDYNAQYLIQWHMIKYAAEHKYKTYNFYGIQGLPDKSSKDYGIYDFKKGFTSEETGRVVELIGAFELPISQTFYHLHHFLSKLKHH